MTSAPIRVVLVDDHPVVIAGAKALIDTDDEIVCVGEADTGAGALALVREVDPDVIVLDLSLPDIDGIALAEKMIAEGVRGHIVLMTLYEERRYVEQALQTGVRGFVQKRSAGQNLLLAIHTAMLGGLYLDPKAADGITSPPTVRPRSIQEAPGNQVELTKREQEVLRLVALGYSNKEIAWRVAVSVKSIETYKARAIEKLNLHSRAQIVDFAIKQGWMNGVDDAKK
jgi:DNA-binding NarL/FixJ family response regulator